VTRIRLRFVQAFTVPGGQTYFYFRRPGMRRVRLPGAPGSEEFMSAYQSALAAAEPRKGVGAGRNAAGTVAHLVGLYVEGSRFKHEIAPETRRTAWRSCNGSATSTAPSASPSSGTSTFLPSLKAGRSYRHFRRALSRRSSALGRQVRIASVTRGSASCRTG
jgi:hypothetical protein